MAGLLSQISTNRSYSFAAEQSPARAAQEKNNRRQTLFAQIQKTSNKPVFVAGTPYEKRGHNTPSHLRWPALSSLARIHLQRIDWWPKSVDENCLFMHYLQVNVIDRINLRELYKRKLDECAVVAEVAASCCPATVNGNAIIGTRSKKASVPIPQRKIAEIVWLTQKCECWP